jgi:hypothetical protein
MKYVKLFESWLNSVNEKVDVGQLNSFGLKYDDSESYTNSPEKFGSHVAKTITDMFSNASNFKIELKSSTQVKKVTLSTNDGDKFTFNFDKKVLDIASIPGIPQGPFILGLVGNAVVDQETKTTTLAQFIKSVITGADLTEYSDDNNDFTTAVEEIAYIAKENKKPEVISKRKKNISKMTSADFYSLPEKSKIDLFNTVLKGEFVVHPAGGKEIYVVTPSEKLAKKYNLSFTTYETGKPNISGRYLTFKLGNKIDGKESIANLPIEWGTSQNKIEDSQDIYKPINANLVKNILDAQSTTLAVFTLDLLSMSEKGMKLSNGEPMTGSDNILTAVKANDNEDAVKKAAEAWKKEGSPADMTLRADATKETTA